MIVHVVKALYGGQSKNLLDKITADLLKCGLKNTNSNYEFDLYLALYIYYLCLSVWHREIYLSSFKSNLAAKPKTTNKEVRVIVQALDSSGVW